MHMDDNSDVAWREQYTPFGEELQCPAANDNLGGFTGHIKDRATGLNYMQARYYDPVIGRFLSVDPVGFLESGGNPAMFNRYAYVANDPINIKDLFGLCGTDADGNEIGLCGGNEGGKDCLLYTSPSPRDATLSRMPSSA